MELKTNHLAQEKSPYLLQHAHNPVDWYAWGPEAFEKAKKENKPILVSIGYSTCHWCHVMEEESFSNPEIARIMNENLVSIKVDREERPDVDKVYMTAVMSIAGSGGWPLNVFLTPDLKPFYGGTYFPPQDQMGRMGWPKVVQAIGQAWENEEERKKISETANNFTENIRAFFKKEGVLTPLGAHLLDDAFLAFQSDYDPHLGGFGSAPKFPMPVVHHFLLRYSHYASQDKKSDSVGKAALEIVLNTLRSMAQGGIYDLLGGGFHRYSTDEKWHVPHFEKMLYDNAQLAANYLEAFQITQDPFFSKIACDTLDYIRRDLSHRDGGFYSAEDADSFESKEDSSRKKEGAFYVWTLSGIVKVLGEQESAIFCYHYGVKEDGNASDWHGELKGKNVLAQTHAKAETAAHFSKTEEEIQSILNQSIQKLFQARDTRSRPVRDNKIIASWNGLAITAFAKAYQIVGGKEYLKCAVRAVQFIKNELYEKETRQLYHRWADGDKKFFGFLEDYAFLVQGLLDLYESTFELSYLEWAIELNDQILIRFYNSKSGAFYMVDQTIPNDLIAQITEDQDGVEPSGSSVEILNLLRIRKYSNSQSTQEIAQKCLGTYGSKMEQLPSSLPYMLSSVYFELAGSNDIFILGDAQSADTQSLLKEVYSKFLPNRALILLEDSATQSRFSSWHPFVKEFQRLENKATAYVCRNKTCQLPTNNLATLHNLLNS